MNYRSIEDLNRVITQHLHLVPSDVRLIVGIPRSGLLAANLIALHLNLPVTDVDGLRAGRLLCGGVRSNVKTVDAAMRDGGRALVVDDSICTGDAMRQVRRELADVTARMPLLFGAVFAAPESPPIADIHMSTVTNPRIFEWNALHHGVIPRSCVDIDGVLCPDPTDEENDDGAAYHAFLNDTPPRLRPRGEVGWLVTGRLERYRKQTEDWLHRHNIGYRELLMLDLPDQKTRQASNAAVAFKARMYLDTGADLFFESDLTQAAAIAKRSGRDVYCVQAGRLIKPDHWAYISTSLRNRLGRTHWRVRRMLRRWHQPYVASHPCFTGGMP